MFESKNAATPQRATRQRTALAALLGAGVLALAAVGVAFSAQAEGRGPGMGGPGGGMMMFGGPPEHMGRMVDHMLDGLGATEAQRAQIKQIVTGAATDLKAQRQAERGMRERGEQLFTAPNVDANAAEALRQQMLAQHDQASKRVLQAMLDVSRVLTPEQRAKIGARMKERQDIMKDRMQRMDHDHARHEPPPK